MLPLVVRGSAPLHGPRVARSDPRPRRGRAAQDGGRESLLFRTTAGAGAPGAAGPRGTGNGGEQHDRPAFFFARVRSFSFQLLERRDCFAGSLRRSPRNDCFLEVIRLRDGLRRLVPRYRPLSPSAFRLPPSNWLFPHRLTASLPHCEIQSLLCGLCVLCGEIVSFVSKSQSPNRLPPVLPSSLFNQPCRRPLCALWLMRLSAQ